MIRADAGQFYQANSYGNWVGNMTGSSYDRKLAERSTDMTYTLTDSQGNPLAAFSKRGGPNHSMFTLTDAQGQPRVTVNLERGVMGGITATAVFPDGRPMMQTHGNLMRHDFVIKDPSGNDLAKVHEAWASVHDTYNLDVLGSIDPLFPLAFAILIDYEKVK